MRLLRERAPSVPVPQVYNAYRIGNISYILMEFIPGQTARECWKTLSETEKDSVIAQLRQYVTTWRSIKGDFFGSVDGGPCQESIWKHPWENVDYE
jgi:hypothetical protein